MKTVASLRINECVRLVLVDDGDKTEWRFCAPIDDKHSRVPPRNSPEELALIMSLSIADKQRLLQVMDKIDIAYDLLLTGKAMRGIDAIRHH